MFNDSIPFTTYIKGLVADLFSKSDPFEPAAPHPTEDDIETEYCTTVYTTFQVAGIHCWPECPFEEVNYIRFFHRHLFNFDCGFLVEHSDRDIEFIMKKHEIMGYLVEKYWDSTYNCCNFGTMSCEMIAVELCKKFGCTYAEVSEDGENGAIVETYR